MVFDFDEIKKEDKEVYDILKNELNRQRNVIELIASENIVSPAILKAMGSWLNNKYSEGYPGKRYYGGNEFIDEAESLAIERVKKLFGAEHANVQPHAGSQANQAAYHAVLSPGDTILAMALDHGGHLTHGSKFNFSGRLYNFISYGVNKETELIDMDEIQKLAQEHKPKMIVAGYSSYPRKLDFKRFKEIADEVNAYFMVDMAHFAGLAAAKLYPNPIPYAHIVTSTTHKTLRGPRGAIILCQIKDPYGDGKKTLAQKIDSAVFPGSQGGPLEHIILAKAIAFKEAMKPEFISYQEQVIANAKVLADYLQEKGFRLVTGGTDNHLILLDLTNKGIFGKEAEKALDTAGITTNKNVIPYETRQVFDPSGLRIGTPAVTSRGMKEKEMKQIAEWIASVIENPKDMILQEKIRQEVEELCRRFPIYEGIEL
jgi:glycine hydroxymethyltransferase